MKNKIGVGLVALLAIVSFAFGDAPAVAPTKPIEVSVEAGSVAASRGKLAVTVKATVTKKAITFSTTLLNNGGFEYKHVELDNDTLNGVIDALQETLKNPDAEYSKDIGNVTVTNQDSDGKRQITISEKGGGFRDNSLYLDTDNAEALVPVLQKSQGIQTWLADKVTALQPK